MKKFFKISSLAVFLFMLIAAVPVQAASATAKPATDSLRRFFTEVNRFSARFSQVVLDESGKSVQESSGTLWIERPDMFRWDYTKPYKQQIVSDGKHLWVYDAGLQQVTVRPLKGGLGDTPAMLLSGKGRLEEKFIIKPLDTQNGYEWVQLKPRHKDSGYDDIRVGFAQDKLRVIEMVDGFGHVTRVTFDAAKENAPKEDSRFEFTPPEGVDVVGE